MHISRIFLTAALLGIAAARPLPAHGGAKAAPIRDHDDLTHRWCKEDYEATLRDGTTCGTCMAEDVEGITTVGCVRHFPEEKAGTCLDCATRLEALKYLNKEGLRHDHVLVGGDHSCLVGAADLLKLCDPEVREKLRAESRKISRQLKSVRSSSQARRLRRMKREIDHRVRSMASEQGHPGLRGWARLVRADLAAKAPRLAEYATLQHICKTCGRYRPEAAQGVAAMAGLNNGHDAFWSQSCPACCRLKYMMNIDQCSVATCLDCMADTGVATKFCVVCRHTLRGKQVAYPGRPGFRHDFANCMELMRAHAGDPGELGAYDLCACAEN